MARLLQPNPAVYVEYDTPQGRRAKHFTDAYVARRFYASKFKLGKNPAVKGSSIMAKSTTVTKVTPVVANGKATKPAKAATAPADEKVAKPALPNRDEIRAAAPKATEHETAAAKELGLTVAHYRILKAINHKPMSFRELEAVVGGAASTPNLKGDKGLITLGYATEEKQEDQPNRFTITAKGQVAAGLAAPKGKGGKGKK